MGVGAIIGAGIFVLTGTAAALYAGPAVILSFVLAGIACAFVGLCYAELAALMPVSGSTYTYTYASLGQLVAWLVGWNLILEYSIGAAAVAVGWSGYFSGTLASDRPRHTAAAVGLDRRDRPARRRHDGDRHRQPAGRGHRGDAHPPAGAGHAGIGAASTISWWR